jgi:hypothetical protein
MSLDATMLAFEAQNVIGLRMMRLAAGGAAATAEAERMVTEKVFAAIDAGAVLLTGGSAHKVIKGYRRKVRANARRMRG